MFESLTQLSGLTDLYGAGFPCCLFGWFDNDFLIKSAIKKSDPVHQSLSPKVEFLMFVSIY
jgi:hypothetical protein